MAHYQCEKCSTIVTADEEPERCEECGATADVAYPQGPVADDDAGRRPIDGMFDVSGAASQPGKQQDQGGLAAVSTMELDEGDLVEAGDERPGQVEAGDERQDQGGLAAVSTMELDEWDLVETEEDGGAAPPAPPPIAVVSTMELDESDLEEQADTTPPPVPAPSFQPRAGRVAYPIPTDRDDDDQPERHVEMDEMAAAGLPPAPPTPDRALATQTRSLEPQPRGGRKLAAALVVVGVGAALAAALVLRRGPEQAAQGRNDVGAPDLRLPDLEPPDTAPPPDQARPDAPAPDTAGPGQRPRVAGASPAVTPGPRPRPRRPRPDTGPIGDPLEEAQRHYKEGLQALVRGQLNGAIGKFNLALKRNPHLSMAYRGLGLAYQKAGKAGLAKEAFKRYLQMRPNAPDAEAIRKRLDSL